MVSAGWAQETNPALAAFQRFVNGEVPVQEAVVYRRLTEADGRLVNQEWVRFGYQKNTWYALRLEPDPANPTNLIPRSFSGIKGASFTHLWTISDSNVHVVDKIHAGGSGPERNTAFEWNFLQRTLTLGIAIPHDGIGNIRWDGVRFTTRAVTEYDSKGFPAKTNTLQGILKLGTNGSPIMASYPDLPQAAVIRYEYGATNTVLPTAFTLIPKEASGLISRYEFVFRKQGATDLSNTEGYVPMMFADKKLTRSATLWTNALNYSLINNELVPGFQTANPKRTGSLVLGVLGTGIASFLALWYRRTKRQDKQEQRLSRRLRTWAALAVGGLMVSAGWAQETSPAVAAFQRFVNGEEPIQEAVVYRRITNPDGKLDNQEWMRFGFQGNSWYAQRLTPDPANPTKLTSLPVAGLKGASFAHLWTISDKEIHVVAKPFAKGSMPGINTAFEWGFLQSALTLGLRLPHDGIGNIRWDGLRFTSRAPVGRTPEGIPAATNTFEGLLTLGTDGFPATVTYPDLPQAVIYYEYGPINALLPTAFTVASKQSNDWSERYEFMVLKLGRVDLKPTDGYVPAMFADTKLPRSVSLWTNSLAYLFVNKEFVLSGGATRPKRTGSLVLGALVAAIITFLALWYWRVKGQHKTNKGKT